MKRWLIWLDAAIVVFFAVNFPLDVARGHYFSTILDAIMVVPWAFILSVDVRRLP